jgi:uncharacterized Rmd1/YagE family protein
VSSEPSAALDVHALHIEPGGAIAVEAAFVGERIAVKLGPDRIAGSPAVFAIGKDQLAAVFRYGVVVFFNTSDALRREFLTELQPQIARPFAEPERETMEIRLDPAQPEGPGEAAIHLAALTVPRLQAVAEILAKSVVLGHYEEELASVFEVIEPLADDLGRAGRATQRPGKLLQHIGQTLMIQHRMVGRVEVPEKPELLWDHPELERLYIRLEDEFELRERHLALERKLAVISNTAETLLGLLQTRRALRVEWYIVALIAIDIIIGSWELFIR